MSATPESRCANPIFLSIIKEWLDYSLHNNTPGFTTYRNAYNSLLTYPITFQHPMELGKLKGFGPKICDRLATKYREYCERNGLPPPPVYAAKRKATDFPDDDDAARKPKRKVTKALYTPKYRSGGYGIIMALSIIPEDIADPIGIVKDKVIELAEEYTDVPFKAPPRHGGGQGSWYTAWNSMRTLIDKELVMERGRPVRKYALTDKGWEVARRMRETAETIEEGIVVNDNGKDKRKRKSIEGSAPARRSSAEADQWGLSDDDDIFSGSSRPVAATTASSRTTAPSTIPITPIVTDYKKLHPQAISSSAYTVELVLDVREVRTKKDRDYIQSELAKAGVDPLVRSMELGDAQWVAKMKDPELLRRLGAEGDELVLDYIVERKRLDDLIASIKDGRFHEQKFRLKRSGVENVVYVVEEAVSQGMLERYRHHEESVASAMASLQVVSGCHLRQSQTLDDTIRYLARMTRLLRNIYAKKTIHVVPAAGLTAATYLPALKYFREGKPDMGFYVSYEAFSSMASKSDRLTLRDLFLKMLMVTKGVTAEKAIEIQRRWKTPRSFVEAFESLGGEEIGEKMKEMVVKELNYLVGRHKVTKTSGIRLAEVWGGVESN